MAFCFARTLCCTEWENQSMQHRSILCLRLSFYHLIPWFEWYGTNNAWLLRNAKHRVLLWIQLNRIACCRMVCTVTQPAIATANPIWGTWDYSNCNSFLIGCNKIACCGMVCTVTQPAPIGQSDGSYYINQVFKFIKLVSFTLTPWSICQLQDFMMTE
jgi:hypothetical protein